MLRLRSEFVSRLGHCCSVGQRTCHRTTLTAEWRIVLAGLRPGDRPGGGGEDASVADGKRRRGRLGHLEFSAVSCSSSRPVLTALCCAVNPPFRRWRPWKDSNPLDRHLRGSILTSTSRHFQAFTTKRCVEARAIMPRRLQLWPVAGRCRTRSWLREAVIDDTPGRFRRERTQPRLSRPGPATRQAAPRTRATDPDKHSQPAIRLRSISDRQLRETRPTPGRAMPNRDSWRPRPRDADRN